MRFYLQAFVSVLIVLTACAPAPDNAIVVDNDDASLAKRVVYSSDVVTIDAPVAYQKVANKVATGTASGLTLTLVASVSPPIYDGVTLQANEIIIKGNKAYVGYNVKGETFLGAVEIYDISQPQKPELVSSAIFPGTDINGIAVRDNDVYLANASDDETLASPAVLDVIRLTGGKLTENKVRYPLSSYASTDIDIAGNNVFVSTGAANGTVYVLNGTTNATLTTHSINDARGIDSDANAVAVVAGQTDTNGVSSKLYLFDKDAGSLTSSYPLSGATIPYSKSTVELKNGKAVLALGDGGVQLVCLADGSIINTIAPPTVSGLDASVTVSNAVSAYRNALFVANGEAGVYVALTDTNFASAGCAVSNLRVVGSLRLGNLQSVNHVVFRSNMLFVAGGVGGLKIIDVNLGNDLVDADDSEP